MSPGWRAPRGGPTVGYCFLAGTSGPLSGPQGTRERAFPALCADDLLSTTTFQPSREKNPLAECWQSLGMTRPLGEQDHKGCANAWLPPQYSVEASPGRSLTSVSLGLWLSQVTSGPSVTRRWPPISPQEILSDIHVCLFSAYKCHTILILYFCLTFILKVLSIPW